MRCLSAILVILGLSASSMAQTPDQQSNNLESLCKFWGFLKYYHPAVAKGKFDWDQQLISKIPAVKSAKSKEELSRIYITWLNELGPVKKCSGCNYQVEDSMKYNLNISWISDTTLFSPVLVSMLEFIRDNRATKQYYIKAGWMPSPDFSNEKQYQEMVFPDEEYRLLGLFRYWNIINYFFPYKYVIGTDWNLVLHEFVPRLLTPCDTIQYLEAMTEMVGSVHDSHANLFPWSVGEIVGVRIPTFRYKVFPDSVIVTELLSDSLAALNDFQKGDVIIEVNGITISYLINTLRKYAGASNEAVVMRDLKYFLLSGKTDSVLVRFDRNGVVSEKYIRLYSWAEFRYRKKSFVEPVMKELEGNIGYVNMGILTRKQVDSVMQIMMNKRAIIFDVRNYPKGTMMKICAYLNKEPVPFVMFTKPELKYPGTFRWVHGYSCGKKRNEDYYKGLVVILCDEKTQSHAEFTCMSLQTAPNVVTIGSQTAGADGNVTTIPLIGPYKVWMTGLGVYYPDGRKTQRVGIVPDIYVLPTVKGMREGRDEVLEAAINYINLHCPKN